MQSRLTGETWEYKIGDHVGKAYFSARRAKYVGLVLASRGGVLLEAGEQPEPLESLWQLQASVLDRIVELLKG